MIRWARMTGWATKTKPVEPGFIRQRMLDSEAVYRVLEEDDSLVTAEVVQAPGLAQGTRVRLLARAARAMAVRWPRSPR